MTTAATKGKSNLPAKTGGADVPATKEGTMSQRFTSAVIREFSSIGKLQLTPFQQRLAQHLFIKIDQTLTELEKKRTDKNRPALIWQNVNMTRLAIDSIHRIELSLDALIDGHIYPIPYLNSRTGKYDMDLRVGYKGKDYYRRNMAVDPPKNTIYELVHEHDTFRPIKKSFKNPVESYEFVITQPFDRGAIIGGFAYFMFEDESKNELIILTEEDFQKSASKAQSKDFWNGYPEAMRYKTIVNRATSRLAIDPEKVNSAFLAVEADEETADAIRAQEEINLHANTGSVLSIEDPPAIDVQTADVSTAPAGSEPEHSDPSVQFCPDGGDASIEKCTPCEASETCSASLVKDKGKGKATKTAGPQQAKVPF